MIFLGFIDSGVPTIQNIQVQQSNYNLENWSSNNSSQNFSSSKNSKILNSDFEATSWYISPYKNTQNKAFENENKFSWYIDAWVQSVSSNIKILDSTYTLEWAAPKNWLLSGTTVPVDKTDEPILTWKILSWDWSLPSINNLKINISQVRKKADDTFGKWFLDWYSDEYLGMLWASEVDKIFDPKMDKFFVSEFLKSYFNIKLWYRSQKPWYDAVVVQWARTYQYQLDLLSQWRTASEIISIINYDLRKYAYSKQKAKNDFWISTTYWILKQIF